MQTHSGASFSSMEEENDERNLFSRGTNAFQSVFRQVGKQSVPAGEETGVESIQKSRQLAENADAEGGLGAENAVVGKKLDQKVRVSPRCGKAGRAKSKENLWGRASLVKAALSKSTAKGVQSKQSAIQKGGTSPRESLQKGSWREGRVVWRSAEPRNRGAEAVSMRRLSKRELELKRLELRPLLNALRFVESSNRVNVPDGDDGTSIGPFQISMDYHQDVWQQKHSWEKARNVDHAEETVIQYWSIYCPKALETHDFETLAKVHNGGPRGPAVSKTTYYWGKVLRHLKQQQELRIPQDAQHLSPRRAHGGRTKWKDAPRKAERSGGEDNSPILLPSKAPPAKTKSHLPKGHRHVHHARLVHIRPHHGVYRAHVAKEKRGTKGKAGPTQASPPKKGQVIHTRHSSFSSTTTYGHLTQASSSAATFPPQEGSFSLTDSQTPKPLKPSSSLGRNFKTPSPLSSPDEDLTIKPGDSISQWQSPTDSPEPSLAPDSPGADSHSSGAFKLRRVRTHSREDLAVLSETPEAEALVAEMVQQVDRKRGGMKLGFRVSPRARLSPSRRKKHPFRSSAGSEAEVSDAGRPVRCVRLEISTEELQQALEAELSARQKSAGAFQYREQDHSSDDESESSGLSDHEVPSPISSTGSLSPDKAFTLAYLQTAIRRSQKKMAAVMIQRAYQKYRPRREFLKLRATTVRLQQLVRAWQFGRPHRKRFLALRGAVRKLQALWRAKRERRSTLLQAVQERIRFLTMRKAAVEIQRVWRGHFARTVLWALFVDTSDGKEGDTSKGAGFAVENEGAKRALLVDVSDGAAESEAEDEVVSPGWTWKITGVRVELSPKLRLGRKGEKVNGGLQSEDGTADVELPETQLALAPRTLGFGSGDRSPAESRWMMASVIQSFGVSPPEGGVNSTPPLTPRREEELYRQLAELQAHHAAHAGRVHTQSASAQPIAGCRVQDLEELFVSSSADFDSDREDGVSDSKAKATPPLSPSREEALFAQLAELLPSFESLRLGTANLEQAVRAEETSLHAQYVGREAGTDSESCAVSGPATDDVSRERVVEAAGWATEQREERAENGQMGAAVWTSELQNIGSGDLLLNVRAKAVGEKEVEVAGGTLGSSEASVEFGREGWEGAALLSGEVKEAESRNVGAVIEGFDGEKVVEVARWAAEESEVQAESDGNGQMGAASLGVDSRSAESRGLALENGAAMDDVTGERLVGAAAERGEKWAESEGELGRMGAMLSGAEAVDGERVVGAARWAAEESSDLFAFDREGQWGAASLVGELPSAAVLEAEAVSMPAGTLTPVSGSEGLLTPGRESQLLLQLAELIAKQATAVAERNGEAEGLPVGVEPATSPEASLGGVTKEGMPGSFEVGEDTFELEDREDAGESGHVLEERSDNCLALKPSEGVRSELVGDLWALRKGGLFVSKDEKVAAWSARKPLDMVAPSEAGLTAGTAAGDSCLGNGDRCQMEADEAASWPLQKALNEVAPSEAGLTAGKAAGDGGSENVDRCQVEAVEVASWHDQKPLDTVASYEVPLVYGEAASDSNSDSGDRGWPEAVEVVSWHGKEPLEMMAPCVVRLAAGDSCPEGEERGRTGTLEEVELVESAEAVDVGSGEERGREVAELVPGAETEDETHEGAVRECLNSGSVALQAASSDVSTAIEETEEVEGASVREDSAPESEHDLCSPEHFGKSNAAWAPSVKFGGTLEFEPQTRSPQGIDASGLLPLGGEFDAGVFGHQGDPSSGDCSPERYSPTESDASVFALQKPDFNRTPISSPALMLAKAALLDSARKVAFWNDAAANLPLSEQNLRVSIAPPGDTTWEGDTDDLGRAGASPDWHDTGSGFPDDSWTNSPSHRSFSVRESLDQDSSLGEVKVSDCPSPDKSLGLVRAEVEKLEKGPFTLGRGASGQWGVNEGKMLNMEWAHVRLGLGLLKQWILENGSPDRKPQNPGKPQNPEETESPGKLQIHEKPQAALGESFTQLSEASETAAHPMDPFLTPRTLAKSKSEPALIGSDEMPDINPPPNHLGFLPQPPEESGSFLHLLTKRTVARKLSLPLAPGVSSPPGSPSCSPPEGRSDSTNSAFPSRTSNRPASKPESPSPAPTFDASTSGTHLPKPTASTQDRNPSLTRPDPSLTSPLRVELPPDPELSDSPVVSPAEPKSPEKGATFDSSAHTHNNGIQTDPDRRKSYAHSPHGRDGKQCLVCRLWEEGSFVGLRDSPRPRTLRYRTNSLSRSWSSHEMPPVGRDPATSSQPGRNSFHSGSPETTSSPSKGRSSSISIPAGPRPYRGSLNLPLDRSSGPFAASAEQSSPSEGSSVPSSIPVTPRSSRGSLESTSTDQGMDWSSSPSLSSSASSSYGSSRKGVLRGSKHQSPSLPKPQTPKPPSPRPPRPAPGPAHLLPPTGHRNISADVITALVGGSPGQAAPKPRLGLWNRGSKGGRMKSPIGLFPSTMKAAVGKTLEAPAVLLERTSNAQPGKVDDASGVRGGRKNSALPLYNRSSQDAQLVKASAGLSEEAIRERGLRSGESKANGSGESPAAERSAGRFSPARSEKRGQKSEIGTIGSPFVTPAKGNQSPFTPNNPFDELSAALASLSIEDRRLLGGRWSDESQESAEVSGQAEGLEGVMELETEFDAVTPQAEGSPFRGELGSAEAPGARPEAPVALMPTLVKLCQLWEERYVDFRVRAEKYQHIMQELTSLGDEVRMVYYVSPTWGPPSVMKELDEVAAIERSAQEEEQAAELVLRQRDCIHAGLSYQLTQVERLQLYAAWGVRRWSTGRLRRIVYKQLWFDPERCDQSAELTMQFL